MIVHLVDLTKSKRWLPTFGPSQSAWVTDLPKLTATVLHSPLPFITTQSESWYSFYHPTEGRRLSRPSCLLSYRAGFPVYRQSPIQALTRPSVEQPKSTALSRRRTHAKQRCEQSPIQALTRPSVEQLCHQSLQPWVDDVLTLSKDADRHSLVMRGMIVFLSDVYSTSPANVGIIPRHNSCRHKIQQIYSPA